MIGLSTPIFDIDGDFIFYANNLIIDDLTNTTVERRINKVKHWTAVFSSMTADILLAI
jgi:hypothetical protein